MLLETLRANGVNTDFVSNNGSFSGHSVIQINKYGNSCILLHGGANREITKHEADKALDAFSAGDILILQNEICNIPYIIDKAFNKYMKVILNPSPIDDELIKTNLNKISYLILNMAEGEAFTGESHPNRIIGSFLDRFPRLKVVLTLGKQGALYGDALNRIQQSAYRVDEVDTTSAGDTFLGYFISRISMGCKSWNALRMAAMAAALAVTRKGGAESIPAWDEVLQFTASRDKEKQKKQSAERTGYVC